LRETAAVRPLVVAQIAGRVEKEGAITAAMLIRRVLEVSAEIRKRVQAVEGDMDETRGRLADGKGLAIALRSYFRIRPEWEGHLVRALLTSPFVPMFRDAVRKAYPLAA
jgi:hypothetical protein